jgi:hypothetical protein
LLIPKFKIENQGLSFSTLDSIEEALNNAIKTLTEADFKFCYAA